MKSLSIFTLLFFIMCSFLCKAQCLSGNYTIGGSNADYETISAAARALSHNGVCGQVHFKIRPGIYKELIHVTKYAGASEINRVFFEPELADSISVEVRDSSYGSGYNTIFTIDSASYITISRLMFRMTSTFIFKAIHMRNGCRYNTVDHCTFFSQSLQMGMASNYEDFSTIVIQSTGPSTRHNSHNIITNNYFLNGMNGVRILSQNLNYDTANVISKNVFADQHIAAINAEFQRKFTITGNIITKHNKTVNLLPGGDSTGIRLAYLKDTLRMMCNKIYRIGGGSATSINIYDSCVALVSNNYFGISTTNASVPACGFLYNSNSVNAKLYFDYNTIRAMKLVRYPLKFSNMGAVVCRNNNVTGESSYAALKYTNNGTNSYSGSHNNYYSQLSGYIQFNSSSYNSAPAFNAATGYDVGSVSLMPRYSDNTGYAINDTSLVHLGIPLADTLDIDNVSRSTLHPAIGCTEIAVLKHKDIYIRNINSLGMNCPGSHAVTISFQNLGLDTLHSALIGWQVNGVIQSPFSYTGTLNPLDSVTAILIGNFTSTTATEVKVYTINIDGNVDEDHTNDTIKNNRTLGSLAGIYTIGNYNADFKDFVSAFAALQANGICGSVAFKVQNGAYYGMLDLTTVAGSSALNTIIFEPIDYEQPDGVIVYNFVDYNSTAYTIQLSHVHYVTFSHISIKGSERYQSSSTNLNTVLKFVQCSNITVDSCLIQHPTIMSGNVLGAEVFVQRCDSMHFNNNKVFGGPYGFYISGTSPVVNGHIEIRQNNIDSVGVGIWVQQMNAMTIESNAVTGRNISSNQSIYIDEVNGLTLSKNSVQNFNGRVQLQTVDYYQGQRVQITNNFMSSGLSGGLLHADIIHNNIYLPETPAFAGMSALEIAGDSTLILFNNNIANFRTTFNNGAMYVSYMPGLPPFKYSNNNNFYAPSASGIIYNGNSLISLATWNNSTNKDSNSVSINPGYISGADLHVTNFQLCGTGKHTAIMDDIDGDLRPALPAIGADEPAQALVPGFFVWPGDANNDLVADNMDLLELGLQYGNSGSPRSLVSNAWQPFGVSDWTNTLSTGANGKHADCNGNGTVNASDTLAINQNYGLTHPARLAHQDNMYTLTPDIYVLFDQPFYTAGDTVIADVYIGSAASPQNNFYGAAFSLNYNSALVAAGTEHFIFTDSWVGVLNSEVIKLGHNSPGTLNAALTRTHHSDINGYGKIGSFRFILNYLLPNCELTVGISEAVKTDHLGQQVVLNSGIDSVAIVSGPVSLQVYPKDRQPVIYPNPATSVVHLSGNLEGGTVTIYNTLGHSVYSMYSKEKDLKIDISSLPAGIYTLKANGVSYKLIKE